VPRPARIDHCPSCNGSLQIRELYCPTCDIQLRGNFETRAAGPLSRLSEDQLAFLRLFVTSRGNLSDIERTLGVSYPTVRSKLDDLIGAMEEPATESQPAASHLAATVPLPAATPPPPATAEPAAAAASQPLSRREILARIADGRMSPQEGFAVLKQTPSDEA
jgi:hypothetical protein